MFYPATNISMSGSGSGATAAQADARSARTAVDALKGDIERLLMITEALWTILKEQHGYTDEELYRRVEEIDMRDGRRDGKVAKTGPMKCPRCDRTLIGNRPQCLYCGQAIQVDPFQR